MYTILIHITLLSLLEIIFYFNYVGPLESNIFKESFHKSSTPDNNFNPTYLNNSIYFNENNVTNYYQKRSDKAEDDRKDYNLDLYHKTLIYWGILFLITITVTILQLIFKKYQNNIELDHLLVSEEIEMVFIHSNPSNDNLNLINSNNLSVNDNSNSNNDNSSRKNNTNYMYILKNIFYYLLLFGCILGFEYLFFQYIILNYHIISKQELELLIIQTYLPLINNFAKSNNFIF
jgi:hypothetical protein